MKISHIFGSSGWTQEKGSSTIDSPFLSRTKKCAVALKGLLDLEAMLERVFMMEVRTQWAEGRRGWMDAHVPDGV